MLLTQAQAISREHRLEKILLLSAQKKLTGGLQDAKSVLSEFGTKDRVLSTTPVESVQLIQVAGSISSYMS